MSDLKRLAARALGLLDLTNLADDCDSAAIAKLCAKAVTPHGNVAAICIWPRFVAEAKQRLAGKGITLATVANFPAGGDDAGAAADEASRAWAAGADEVDVVIPYRRLMTGDERSVQELVAAAVARRPPGKRLKTILETGELQTPELIAKAARIAIAAGRLEDIHAAGGHHAIARRSGSPPRPPCRPRRRDASTITSIGIASRERRRSRLAGDGGHGPDPYAQGERDLRV